MAERQRQPVQEPIPAPPEESTSLIPVTGEVPDLFNRPSPLARPIKSIRIGSTLTKELIAMAHREQLIFTCTGEMETMTLPTTGRTPNTTPARVVSGVDEFDFAKGIPQSKECILVFNEMMVSALSRAGFRVVQFVPDGDDKIKTVYVGEKSIVGKSFAFRSQGIKADKSYRVIDVVPLEIER